eukprot:TRINITY_DN3368_c0_g1_i1.p1 TRINITY_DN3368_c0_g1~~TRINITY_DN3368_c0_g1_i1.p1  ORF type:complete len:647 (+),score=146.86 TRINITY_DN3368_c0_g1_i1:631-2571(+)
MEKKLSSVDEKSVVHFQEFSSLKEVTASLVLKPEPYALIPCTHESGHSNKYSVLLYSTCVISSEKSSSVSLSSSHKGKDPKRRGLESRSQTVSSSKKSSENEEEKAAIAYTQVRLKKESETQKAVGDKIAALEAEKANWATEREALAAEVAECRKLQEAALKAYEELEKNEDKHQEKMDSLLREINETKLKKNQQEDDMFDELDELRRQLAKYESYVEEEDNEEAKALSWTKPITTDAVKGTEISLKGEWKGTTCGGSLNHLTWVNNPQIFLRVTQEATIDFSLFQPVVADKKLSISFYVFKTHSPSAKRLVRSYNDSDIVCEAYFSSLKPSKVHKSATLAASPNPYVIVPVTFIPGDESPFILQLKSNVTVEATPIAKQNEWPTIEGEWTSSTAGGCTNFSSFSKNNMYLCRIKNQTKATFHVSNVKASAISDSISVYVLRAPGEGQKLREYNSNLLVASGQFVSSHEGHVTVNLKPGSYLIVPCTFNPNSLGCYTLRVLSEDTVEPLVLLPEVSYVVQKGVWKGSTAGGSFNYPESWKNNPQYLLKIKKELTITIVLTQAADNKEKAFSIGWSLTAGSSRLTEPSSVATASYRPSLSIVEEVTLKPGSYVVVPTTFNPGEESSFEFKITSYTAGFSGQLSLEAL